MFLSRLQRMEACKPFIKWVSENEIETAAEFWEKCQNPQWMIWFLLSKNYRKGDCEKLRLFAVWCAKYTPLENGRVSGDLLNEGDRYALDAAEKFANGLMEREKEMWIAGRSATAYAAYSTTLHSIYHAVSDAAAYAAYTSSDDDAISVAFLAQANKLREIFGNMFENFENFQADD